MFNPKECEHVSMAEAKEREKAQPINEVIRLTSRSLAAGDSLKNEEIASLSAAYNEWTAGVTYQKGEVVTDPANGRQYILAQTTTASEVYPPHAEGVLANYRPVPIRNADGTFVFVYGQNVFTGDRCLDAAGVPWRAKKDMLPCIWPPADGNEWERE